MNIYERRSPALNKLVAQLRRTGDTYGDIARGAGVSPSTVANLLTGKTRSPHFKTVEFMLDACGFSVGVAPPIHNHPRRKP